MMITKIRIAMATIIIMNQVALNIASFSLVSAEKRKQSIKTKDSKQETYGHSDSCLQPKCF
jgi:hypothetical protein